MIPAELELSRALVVARRRNTCTWQVVLVRALVSLSDALRPATNTKLTPIKKYGDVLKPSLLLEPGALAAIIYHTTCGGDAMHSQTSGSLSFQKLAHTT